jgi:V-type H+-transporting ATPase subunit H
MGKISKESVLQYTVTVIDDMLQENKQRVELYHEYARLQKENIYAIFLKMLYRDDPFIVNQICRIISKIACWSADLMPEKELNEYFSWIIDHLNERVNFCFFFYF